MLKQITEPSRKFNNHRTAVSHYQIIKLAFSSAIPISTILPELKFKKPDSTP